MSNYLNDQEQVELLKSLWKKYGNWALTIVTVIVLIIAGWRFYNHYHQSQVNKASTSYYQLLEASLNPSVSSADIILQAQYMMKHYRSTGYAVLAAMILAEQQVTAGHLNQAKQSLQWAIKHSDNQAYQAIARVRLARVVLAQGDAQQALTLVAKAPRGFVANYAIVAGQAHAKLKQFVQARASYNEALKALPKHSAYRDIVLTYLSGLPS